MSPKSRGRGGSRGRNRPGKRGRHPSARRQETTTYASMLSATIKALEVVQEPLIAEELASFVVGSWVVGHTGDAGEPSELAVETIGVLEELGALPALLVIRAMTESDVHRLVDEAAQRVLRRVPVVPNWTERLGRVELIECLKLTEMLRDQDMWVLRFRYIGDDPEISHVLTVSIDRNRGGIVRDIGLAGLDDADLIYTAWATASSNAPEVRSEVGDPAEASLALATAVARTDLQLFPDLTDDALGRLALLRTRLRALPPLDLTGRELAWRQVDDERAAETLAAEFAHEFAADTDGARFAVKPSEIPSTVEVESLAQRFLESTGLGDEHLRWSPIRVEILLLEWLPRKAVLEPDEIAATPDILRALVRWALERQQVPAEGIEQTVAAVGQWEADFANEMRESAKFGPAKQSLLEMQRDGVDIDDSDAISRWIDEHQKAAAPRQASDRP